MNTSQLPRLTLRAPYLRWRQFIERPIGTQAIGRFRIAIGVMLLIQLFELFLNRETFFGLGGLWPYDHWQVPSYFEISLLGYFVPTPGRLTLFFAVLFVAALGLTVGLFSRTCALISWIGITSLQNRNMHIIHAGDVLFKVALFALILAPLSRSWSLDRLWYKRRHGVFPSELAMPVAQRLLQLQFCIVYLCTLSEKLRGATWIEGTAVYYLMYVSEFIHLPLPAWLVDSVFLSKIASWGTLAIEGLFPVLVWFRETRRLVLIASLMMHLGMWYVLDIPYFQGVVLSYLLLF